ncbi:hypothetical protein [Kordia sp.]|jgi:hypothetical protein|uniref:hypothetical protein n=1 Tax=Kordia sp. TaxID=1965332 RepID=UPI0025BEA9F7|nr:hypothetical protein [Kordia sp.]MCH2083126.1 hypothetical protein [Saprospiraceae bacterium]MCH2193303.1 hypothetical protein [Kordia sp.]
MNKLSLSRSELQELIGRYYSEVRKLSYQLQKTQKTIQELQSELNQKPVFDIPDAPIVSITSTTKGTENHKSGTDSNAEVITEGTKKRKKGRPSENENRSDKKKSILQSSSQRRGYKLSETDNFVMGQLNHFQKPLIAAEIIYLAEEDAKTKGEKFDLDDFKIKLNRSIHKLANRRGDILKLRYEGRGFSYALPEWTSKDGKLKKKFSR